MPVPQIHRCGSPYMRCPRIFYGAYRGNRAAEYIIQDSARPFRSQASVRNQMGSPRQITADAAFFPDQIIDPADQCLVTGSGQRGV